MEFVKLNFEYSKDVTVVNKAQFEAHMRLYEGYINKMNEIDKLLLETGDLASANSTYSTYRGIKRGETYALDGVILHELYFQNIGGRKKPGTMAVRYMDRDFGGYKLWKDKFVATAKASRGWAILAYDYRSDRFRNISLDAHDLGNIALSVPVLVLDMYEHAYFLQYADDKAEYIKKFMENIDWDVVEDRINYCLKKAQPDL